MQAQKYLITIVTVLSMACTAYAGPPVTVTFNNLGNVEAEFTVITVNESSTFANADPKPLKAVPASTKDIYTVQNKISPNGNAAIVRYRMGTSPLNKKECIFGTTYTNIPSSGGTMLPKWTKNATANGGAICTATITSTNFSTHAWSVEFTMR